MSIKCLGARGGASNHAHLLVRGHVKHTRLLASYIRFSLPKTHTTETFNKLPRIPREKLHESHFSGDPRIPAGVRKLCNLFLTVEFAIPQQVSVLILFLRYPFAKSLVILGTCSSSENVFM